MSGSSNLNRTVSFENIYSHIRRFCYVFLMKGKDFFFFFWISVFAVYAIIMFSLFLFVSLQNHTLTQHSS